MTPIRRILVTGGSGFIGTNLVDRLRRAESTTVANYDIQRPRYEAHAQYWVEGDLLASDRLLATMEEFRPTHLVHLAARTDIDGRSMDGYRSNTDGVQVVLNCVAAYGGLQRAIYASSRLVCELGEAPTSEYDYYPPNCYGRSKVVGEQLVRAHHDHSEWVIVRPTSIWGPWGGAPYRDFFVTLARGTYVHPAHERIHKHYGYVGNVAYQIDRLLTAPAERVHGRTFYLADPQAIEVGSMAAEIRRALGLPPPRSVPISLLRMVARTGDALKTAGIIEPPLTSSRLRNLRTEMLYDLAEIDEIVGPLPFSLSEAIDNTIAYLRDHGDIPAPSTRSRRRRRRGPTPAPTGRNDAR
jgi:GlcNAc-P-P-Und epimerase